MVVGESVQDSLVELVVTVRVTVPVNPSRGAIVIADVPVTPTSTDRLVGFAEIVKSGDDCCVTVTETFVEWERDPLDPVTVTVYVPAAVEDCAETVSVDVAVPPDERVTLEGLRVAVGPVGETTEERATAPVKPPMLVNEIVDLPDEPAGTVSVTGLAEMRKSTTLTLTMAE